MGALALDRPAEFFDEPLCDNGTCEVTAIEPCCDTPPPDSWEVTWTCPACGGDNVECGAIALRCGDCGWSHLNKYPCTECGEPAVAAAGFGGDMLYWCREHAPRGHHAAAELLRAALAPRVPAFVIEKQL